MDSLKTLFYIGSDCWLPFMVYKELFDDWFSVPRSNQTRRSAVFLKVRAHCFQPESRIRLNRRLLLPLFMFWSLNIGSLHIYNTHLLISVLSFLSKHSHHGFEQEQEASTGSLCPNSSRSHSSYCDSSSWRRRYVWWGSWGHPCLEGRVCRETCRSKRCSSVDVSVTW